MNLLKNNPFLYSIFLLVGCTLYIPITESTDEFSQSRTVKMDNCKLEANYPSRLEAIIFDRGTKTIELNLEYTKISPDSGELAVIAEIYSEGESFTIDQGESLIFLIDGNIIKLSTKGGYNSDMDVKTSGYQMTTVFSSKAKFPISPQLVNRIASGQVVKARLLGYDPNASESDKPALEGIFYETHKNAYKDFLAKIEANLKKN